MMRFVILLILFLPLIVKGQEHARILDHVTKYIIHDKGNAEIEEYYKIQINSEQGKYFSVFQQYIDQFHKIKKVSVTVFDKNGNKVKKFSRGNGTEYGMSASYEINDSKVFVINPKYEQYPYTVEVESTIKLSGFLSLPTWMPRLTFNLAVDNSLLVVERPETQKMIMREEHISGTTKTEDGNLITEYRINDLAHIDRKIRYQDFYDMQPKVFVVPEEFELDNSVGRNTSWEEFGDWYVSLNSEPYELTAETKQFIDGLSNLEAKEKIKEIYEFMQDKTRYVSIQLGIGGFKSLPTEDVEKFGYGDCKALSTYMRNMLDYAGINANYILVKAGRDVPDVKKEFPSNQFNHVYLGIPLTRDTVYLECTSQTVPTNHPGSFTDDRNVLWIEENNSQIIRSRIYGHDENIQQNKAVITIEEDGNALLDLQITNKGIFYDKIMIYNSGQDEYIRNYNQRRFNYKDFSIKNFSFVQKQRDIAEFNINYQLEIPGLGKGVGDRLILPLNFLEPIDDYIDQNDMMQYSAIKRGITVEDEVEIALPTNYWIYNIPEKEKITSIFGEYELSTEFDGEKILIKRKLILYKGNYKKEEYKAFKEYFNQLQKIERKNLVLNSKT